VELKKSKLILIVISDQDGVLWSVNPFRALEIPVSASDSAEFVGDPGFGVRQSSAKS
jgi:hypothetical protein